MVVLRTTAPLRGEELKTIGDFVVTEGQTVPFVLTYSASHLPPPEPVDAQAALADTEAFWREWSNRCVEVGEWTPAVRRSLITLKALTYRPTGGIVAAPRPRCPSSSAVRATGITASAGFAMQP
jgi:GH15 family glucan-1,4-alpha-glucosidase